MANLKAKFDDMTKNEDGTYWSQICKECAKKLSIPNNLLDNIGSGICGVKGCNKESFYYIDFRS